MIRPFKVLYIIHSSTKYEGSNRSLLNMITGLMQNGVFPFVILPRQKDMSICLELAKLNIPYRAIKFYKDVYPKTNSLKDYLLFLPRLINQVCVNLFAVKKIISFANAAGTQIIHTNIGPLTLGYKVALQMGLPHVWHLREYQDLDFNFNTFYSKEKFIKMLNNKQNYIVPITKGIAQHFHQSQDKIIYNGVANKNETKFIEKKDKYFLFVGQLSHVKGIDFLIKNFAEFVKIQNDYKLYIAGETAMKEFKSYLHSLAAEHKISSHIIFLGNRDDIPNLMANATALIMPSIHEGFGRVTAEAMFNGCLVIGNNSGGTKEILQDGNLGIIYSGGEELVDAMKTVVKNGAEHYFETVKHAQNIVVQLYSNEQNTLAIYKLYEKCML